MEQVIEKVENIQVADQEVASSEAGAVAPVKRFKINGNSTVTRGVVFISSFFGVNDVHNMMYPDNQIDLDDDAEFDAFCEFLKKSDVRVTVLLQERHFKRLTHEVEIETPKEEQAASSSAEATVVEIEPKKEIQVLPEYDKHVFISVPLESLLYHPIMDSFKEIQVAPVEGVSDNLVRARYFMEASRLFLMQHAIHQIYHGRGIQHVRRIIRSSHHLLFAWTGPGVKISTNEVDVSRLPLDRVVLGYNPAEFDRPSDNKLAIEKLFPHDFLVGSRDSIDILSFQIVSEYQSLVEQKILVDFNTVLASVYYRHPELFALFESDQEELDLSIINNFQ